MNSRIGPATVLLGLGLGLAGCASESQPGHMGIPGRAGGISAAAMHGRPETEPPELTEESTLGDYLAYAALNNSALEAAFNRWKAALERVPQVRALPDPRFTYRYYIREVETRVGAQRQSFGIAQTLPWLGKLELRGDVAAEAANAERQRYEAEKRRLFYQVRDAYCEYYYLGKALHIVRQNIRLLQQIERVARTRYKAGAASHPDVIRLQVELGKLDDRSRTLADLRGPMVARLNAALNRPAEAPLPWPTAIPDQQVSVTDAELLVWLAESNPELKALDHEIAQSRSRIALAGKDYFPDVTVGVDYIDTAGAVGAMRPSDSGKDPVIAMVSINLPLWWDKIAAGVREARFRHLVAVHRKQAKTNALSAALKLAAYRFRDAERKINLYRDTLLPKANQSLKATETAFRAGKATFTDLIDSQRILLEFELAFQRALADKAQRLAELEMLVGKEIAQIGNVSTQPAVPKGETPPDGEEERP